LQDRVEFLGLLKSDELHRRFQEADGFLFTSLRDSQGSVVWEALGEGLPVITLDHQGVGALVPKDAALKVPVETPEITLAGLTAAIEEFARMGPRRAEMSEAALRAAAGNVWQKRAATVTRYYEQILNQAHTVASFERPATLEPGSPSGSGR
jgi:glycosyltransferase involved in cell wall biosynthesis